MRAWRARERLGGGTRVAEYTTRGIPANTRSRLEASCLFSPPENPFKWSKRGKEARRSFRVFAAHFEPARASLFRFPLSAPTSPAVPPAILASFSRKHFLSSDHLWSAGDARACYTPRGARDPARSSTRLSRLGRCWPAHHRLTGGRPWRAWALRPAISPRRKALPLQLGAMPYPRCSAIWLSLLDRDLLSSRVSRVDALHRLARPRGFHVMTPITAATAANLRSCPFPTLQSLFATKNGDQLAPERPSMSTGGSPYTALFARNAPVTRPLAGPDAQLL